MAMTMEHLAGVLEEAVDGLTTLDAERLEKIERELSAGLSSGPNALFAHPGPRQDEALRAVVATHRLLGSLLASTSMNLNVLHGLRTRNDMGDGRWGR